MLTREAIRERIWGRFPLLQGILEGRSLTGQYQVWSSVSDTVFDRMGRTATLAAALECHEAEVLMKCDSDAMRAGLERELDEAIREIERTAEWYREQSHRIRVLQHRIRATRRPAGS